MKRRTTGRPENGSRAGRGGLCLLLVVVTVALGIAAWWAVRVPIYQSPDESEHLDLALAIRAHRRPFVMRHRAFEQLPRWTHPYSTYLARRTGEDDVMFNPAAKMPPGYGTAEFFAELNRDAPAVRREEAAQPDSLAAVYPPAYYTLLAGWIGLLAWRENPVVVFFVARAFSVALLAITLVASYGACRLLPVSRRTSLLVVACTGFFPLTSFVCSYVQPDNLALALASLVFFLALIARKRWAAAPWLALAGGGLGVLAVTKAHVALAVAVPVIAMLGMEVVSRRGWRRLPTGLALLVGPAVLFAAMYAWSVAGTRNINAGATHPWEFGRALAFLKEAFWDYYSGTTHASFWGIFGWMDTPLVIGGPGTNALIRAIIQFGTWCLLGLTLIRLEQVASRLFRLAMRGRRAMAVRLALSNPLVNSYFLFTLLMIALYVWTENVFRAQGRNWLPLLVPHFLVALNYAPRALTLRGSQRVVTAVLGAALLIYGFVGNYYGLSAIRARFYLPGDPGHYVRSRVDVDGTEARALRAKAEPGDAFGPGSYNTVTLPESAYADGLEVHFRLAPPKVGRYPMRVSWRADDGEFSGQEPSAVVYLSGAADSRKLYFAISGAVKRIRLDVAAKPEDFQLHGLTLLKPGVR